MPDKISKIYDLAIPLVSFVGYLFVMKNRNQLEDPMLLGLSRAVWLKICYIGIVLTSLLIIRALLK